MYSTLIHKYLFSMHYKKDFYNIDPTALSEICPQLIVLIEMCINSDRYLIK